MKRPKERLSYVRSLVFSTTSPLYLKVKHPRIKQVQNYMYNVYCFTEPHCFIASKPCYDERHCNSPIEENWATSAFPTHTQDFCWFHKQWICCLNYWQDSLSQHPAKYNRKVHRILNETFFLSSSILEQRIKCRL